MLMWYPTHLERMPQCPNTEAFKLAVRRTVLFSEVAAPFPPLQEAFACFDRGFSPCHLTQCVTIINTQQISTGISDRISPLVNRIGDNWPSSHWFLSLQSAVLGIGKYKKSLEQFLSLVFRVWLSLWLFLGSGETFKLCVLVTFPISMTKSLTT